MTRTYYLVSKRYRCKVCRAAGQQYTFNAWDPEVLELYPDIVKTRLGIVFTYKCAVTQVLADYITDHAITATSFHAIHKHVHKSHHRE